MARPGPLLVTIALAALLLACNGGDATPARSPAPLGTPAAASIQLRPGEAIRIGVSVALSGDQQALGGDIADAAVLAAADAGGSLRGHPIEVVRLDDGCGDAEAAVAVARSFIAMANLAAVIGPMCTTGAQAAGPLYEAAHMLHVSPSATRVDVAQPDERFFFRTAWRDDAQGRVQAAYARDAGAATAVVIDDGGPYGRTLGDGFVGAFQQSGGSVLARQRIARGATDFSGLASQVRSANPDAVVFEGVNPEAALIVRALGFAQYRGAFIAPDGVLSARDFIASAGEAAQGAILTGGATPDEAYVAHFRDRFQRVPSTPFVLQARDAVAVVLAAIDAAAADKGAGALELDRDRLADTLRSGHYIGLTGAIRFAENGDRGGGTASDLGLAIYRVRENAFERLPY